MGIIVTNPIKRFSENNGSGDEMIFSMINDNWNKGQKYELCYENNYWINKVTNWNKDNEKKGYWIKR